MTSTARPFRTAITSILALSLGVLSLLASDTSSAQTRRERREEAQERLMELEKEFELVVEEFNATNEELLQIQAEMAGTRLVVDEIQERMNERQSDAVSLAQELYKSGGTVAAMDTVLSARTLAELETSLAYLEASQASQAEVFERLAVDRAELNRHLSMLEEDRAEAQAKEARLAELREEIESKVDDQKDEIEELNEAIAEATRRRQEAARAAAEAAARAAASAGQAPAPPAISMPANPAPAPNPAAQTAVDAALSQVGKPYQWGAEGPDSYDCSGLTLWAWAHAGVSLPHNSGMQYNATPRVAREDLAPGDLLFYGSPIHHVSMYIGNGQMVEAPYTGQFVRVVSANRWSDFVGAGRPGV